MMTERVKMRYVSCPSCGKQLFKVAGNCSVEITCVRCKKEIVGVVDEIYITNTSGDEKLDEYMENYFNNTVGFDKVYFAPTKKYLASSGGLDCLTKEL